MSAALDWFLSDPALILPKAPVARVVDDRVGKRVRFRAGSQQAAGLQIPVEAIGIVRSVMDEEGELRANVDFAPVGFVFGARMAELEIVLHS